MRLIVALALVPLAFPQNPDANYDESKVGGYQLPDLLGSAKTAKDWTKNAAPKSSACSKTKCSASPRASRRI